MTRNAVIFDLDNTLVNRRLAFREYSKRFIGQYIAVSDSAHHEELVEWIRRADRDGYRKKRELYEEILHTLPMISQGTTVEEMLHFWFSEFYKCTVLMEGALDILADLKCKGLKLGIITNGSVHTQNSKIDQVMLRDYFDVIIVSDEVQLKKPDKRIFELALERLNAEPQESWYVGDHPVNDIQGALSAGLNTVWLKGYTDLVESLTDETIKIDRLQELTRIFDGIR